MTQSEEITSFEQLGLRENLLRGIFSYGFESPSPIQRKAIAPMLSTKDIIAQAKSGTGKTGTFSIGVLQLIDQSIPVCQAIIVAPTRELAEQINHVFTEIGSYDKVKTSLCIGGADIRTNRKELENGACCAIGTPGRIKDMIGKKYLRLDSIKVFVMDEADELLKEGFIEQIQEIIGQLPKDCQICLFSATL